MAAISQMMFSDAFSWMKIFIFLMKISLSFMVQLTITQHWFRWCLALNRWQAIIWTNADPIHGLIYAALGRDEFKGQINKIILQLHCTLYVVPRVDASTLWICFPWLQGLDSIPNNLFWDRNIPQSVWKPKEDLNRKQLIRCHFYCKELWRIKVR